MPVVEASDGRALEYGSVGDVEAPTVVCIHGVTLDRHALDDQVTALSEAGYRVITWDLRGHGSNQPIGEHFSVEQAADDLLAIVSTLSAGRVILLAQSFGGLVAQVAYREDPDAVSALVLVGSPALEDRPPLRYRVFSRLRPTLLRAWPEGHLRRVTPALMSRDPRVQQYVSAATGALSKAALVEVSTAAVKPLVSTASHRASSIPVLLIRGSSEVRFVARMIDDWASRDPNVWLVRIDHAGHLVNIERPAETSTAVLCFLHEHGLAPAART